MGREGGSVEGGEAEREERRGEERRGGLRDKTAMRWRIKTGRERERGREEEEEEEKKPRLALGCRSVSPQRSPWELRHWTAGQAGGARSCSLAW